MLFLLRYPISNLIFFIKNNAGRNSFGHLCCFRRGSRYKKNYRMLDFKHFFWNVFAIVLRMEYDPFRNLFVFLICYQNGILSYILPTVGLKPGAKFFVGSNYNGFLGDISFLSCFEEGSYLHSIEYFNCKGSKISRSSGSFALLVRQLGNSVILRFPSKEYYILNASNLATLGKLPDLQFHFRKFYKAGQMYTRGRRSIVRGVAKNPVDHPHGGGEGRTSGGRPSVTIKSLPAKNRKTRKVGYKSYSFSIGHKQLNF